MKTQLPEEFEQRLAQILPQPLQGLFGPKRYQGFRINTLKIAVPAAQELLAERKIAFDTVDFCPYAISVEKSLAQSILDSDLIAQGLLYSQGLESMLPVIALDPQPKQRVLDLCAAPGSKTSQMAMHMHNEGFLQANEPIRTRLFKLKSVLELTASKAKLSSIDGRRFRNPEALFDKVLVDAPCSSEGRFMVEEPKSFAYWSVRKIKEMSHKQKGLLLNASRLLQEEGTLVYSTCTFAPEENEEVVDWFLRKTEGQFQIIPTGLNMTNTYPSLGQWQKRSFDSRVNESLRIMPNERMDAFFIAKFKKSHYK